MQASRFTPVGSFAGREGGAVHLLGMDASRPGSEIKTCSDDLPCFSAVWNHALLELLPVQGMERIVVPRGRLDNGQVRGSVGVSEHGRLSAEAQTPSGMFRLNQARAGGVGVLKLRGAWALPVPGRGAAVFVALENLGDKRDARRPGHPMPGRVLQACCDAPTPPQFEVVAATLRRRGGVGGLPRLGW